MRMCFTINQNRKQIEIESYYGLIEDNLFQAIEIFYPINTISGQYEEYTKAMQDLFKRFPHLERVLHLPHGNRYSLCNDDCKENVQIMLDAIEYAHLFKVNKLTLHLGYFNPSLPREVYIKKVVPELKTIAKAANKYQMKVMIENMPTKSELGYSPEEILDIINEVDEPNVKFIFDTGHAHVSEYSDTSYLDLLKDYLYHIHYSDNNGSSDQHTYIGNGNIDFKKHFEKLKEINYKELHCLEIIYQNADDLRKYLKEFNLVKEE